MLTFYNRIRTAIKKKDLFAKYTFEVLSSLDKSFSVNFDWGYISFCQLTVHFFNCKIQVYVFCVYVCIISC